MKDVTGWHGAEDEEVRAERDLELREEKAAAGELGVGGVKNWREVFV